MCLPTQKRHLRLVALFCLLLSYYSVHSQITLFGDLYIAPQNEMHIASGDLYFESGKIITDRGANSGTLSFAHNSSWEKADHNTHVDGFTRFYDTNKFTFPVGHDNVLQPVQFYNFSGSDHFDLSYHHRGHQITDSDDAIAEVSNTHYWELLDPKGEGRVILSWNVFSNVDKLLGSAPSPQKALDLISIGGFDGFRWVSIPSEISDISDYSSGGNSLLEGYIQTKESVDFSKFSAFTLVMRKIPAIDSKDISQAITPNGDGKNDTWIIKNIEQYPKANVSVYNRWGEAVFSTSNGYNNDWGGNHNNNGDILPTGPYLYLIDYENDGKIDLKGWIYISN